MLELIDKSKAYKALMHEADTHMRPEYKEAYERAARIIGQMKPTAYYVGKRKEREDARSKTD